MWLHTYPGRVRDILRLHDHWLSVRQSYHTLQSQPERGEEGGEKLAAVITGSEKATDPLEVAASSLLTLHDVHDERKGNTAKF